MVRLRQELASDADAIESLLDLCFGADRHRKTSYQYRQGVSCLAALSLVAVDDHDILVGTIRYWPIHLGDAPALLLGPIAVHPDLHGRGIGRALVFTSLSNADAQGFDTIFLVGDADYYHRFGFATAPSHIVMPGEQPLRLQYRLLSLSELPSQPSKLTSMSFSQPLPGSSCHSAEPKC